MQTLWEHRYSSRAATLQGSAIRELLKLSEQPDVISFGGGFPAPEVFPIKEFEEACSKVLKNQGARSLQYSTTEGYNPLRELIIERAQQSGIKLSLENVLVTSGSQQALDMLGKLFVDHGTRILVESPTYLGALQAWNVYNASYINVPTDENGMNPEGLEAAFRSGPRFIYALPTFQNPAGITISLERRKKIVEIANRYGIPIVEDDPYGKLRFEGKDLPTLQDVDNQTFPSGGLYDGNVIYLSTFSKLLAPGLRLAWVIAPAEVISKLVMIKQGTDLHTATFNQMISYEVARNGFLDRHIETIKKVYRERRNVMLDSLEEHMPEGVRWTHPQGGLFLWVTLPGKLNSIDLFKEAVKQKVAFVPGNSFFPNGGGENNMRLNFSNATPEKINEGISRLGTAIKQMLK